VGKCIASEPRHGEVWARVAKDPRNAHKKPDEILQLVAAQLE
jgi:pre-mRNA-processing factor 6